MTEKSIKKVSQATAPTGDMGQHYLACGKSLAMRLWKEDKGDSDHTREREYETVGYVIEGKAELRMEGQLVQLEPGDCWLVPAGARHSYMIREPFTAVEATSPPARIHGRDESPTGME